MPLEKKYENNADIAAQQSIEIGNVFNIVRVMSRGISTSDKVLAPAFVTNIFVTRTFWAGAIRKINKCAIKEIKSIIANVNKNIFGNNFIFFILLTPSQTYSLFL